MKTCKPYLISSFMLLGLCFMNSIQARNTFDGTVAEIKNHSEQLVEFSNLSVLDTDCDGEDQIFQFSFDVTGGSGQYQLVNVATDAIVAETFPLNSDPTDGTVTLTGTFFGYSEEGPVAVRLEDPNEASSEIWPTLDVAVHPCYQLIHDAFVTEWQTSSTDENITIATRDGGYDYSIDWGDGNLETGLTGNATHTYALPGTYHVRIIGKFPRIFFPASSSTDQIIKVLQWGNIAWTSMEGAFEGCSNLTIEATDNPDLSGVTSMYRMFMNCTNLTSSTDNFSTWDVSQVASMSYMFGHATLFNEDIGNWDVSQVGNMTYMFIEADAFNQDIGAWTVEHVTAIFGMFSGAESFNQDIGAWDISSALALHNMFKDAVSFDQNLGNWDVSNVFALYSMFEGAGLSTPNYDSLLLGWSSLPSLQNNLTFDAGSSQFCLGAEAMCALEDLGWTITDGGLDPECALPQLSCPGSLVREVDLNCQYVMEDFSGLVPGNLACIDEYTITQTPAPGEIIDLSGTVTSYSISVNFTIQDANNSSSCSFELAFSDPYPPTAVCEDLEVTLNEQGMATITADQIDGGSSDGCGIESISIDINSFYTADLGENPVVLTLGDLGGNTSSCTALVTVLPYESSEDSDGDGISDDQDNCPANFNPFQADKDGDGVGNRCDNCRNTPNHDQADDDGDGVGNACDNCMDTPNRWQADSDNDGVGNRCDNCRNKPNPGQADTDGDGVGNACDNCPDTPNRWQADFDGDGIGNACDNRWNIANIDSRPGLSNENTPIQVSAFPNPFASSVSLRVRISHSGKARLDIFDLQGQMVKSIFNGNMEAGEHQFEWDASSLKGSALPAGIYLARFGQKGEKPVTIRLLIQANEP